MVQNDLSEKRLLQAYEQLSEVGKDKALEYIMLIVKYGAQFGYTKESENSNIIHLWF